MLNTHTLCSHGTDELSRVLIHLSKADMELSRADMELSKAEGSVGRLEADWIKWAKITIAALLALAAVAFYIFILAVREDYVYKKAINHQNRA
jgi:hypothetical protein